MRALVIGGTGPTGHFVVNGLIARGFEVSILHTGNHEVAEIPASVIHIHTNPFDEQALRVALDDSHFDITLAMYGRLRRVAEIMVGRTERFISVGGGPAYRGFMNADMVHPPGLPVRPAASDDNTLDQRKPEMAHFPPNRCRCPRTGCTPPAQRTWLPSSRRSGRRSSCSGFEPC